MQVPFEEPDETDYAQLSESVPPTRLKATKTKNISYQKGARHFTVRDKFKKEHVVKAHFYFIRLFLSKKIVLGTAKRSKLHHILENIRSFKKVFKELKRVEVTNMKSAAVTEKKKVSLN